MSELAKARDLCVTIQRQLLATASTVALIGYVASTISANADDSDRPTVWIELGGQLERASGGDHAYSPSFFELLDPSITSPDKVVDALPLGFGPEGKISFQPKGSNLILSVGVRYGRALSNRNTHQVKDLGEATNRHKYLLQHYTAPNGTYYYYKVKCCHTYQEKREGDYADVQSHHQESHFVLDFQAGKDVGLGVFGKGGSSVVNAGLRIAQFVTKSEMTVKARGETQNYNGFSLPSYAFVLSQYPSKYTLATRHREFSLTAGSSRSFTGIGPSLSWDASAALLGHEDTTELTFDWSVNAAVLFGRQKAATHHQSSGLYHQSKYNRSQYGNSSAYNRPRVDFNRSRNVIVPNVGGMAGFSIRFPNARVSMGYRADIFFNAMDAGWDTLKTQSRSFYGPFATISIGLGG